MARPVLGEVTRGLRTALRFHVLTAEVSRRAHDSISLLIGFEHEALLVRWAVQPSAALLALRRGVGLLAPAGWASAGDTLQRATLGNRQQAEKPAATLPAGA